MVYPSVAGMYTEQGAMISLDGCLCSGWFAQLVSKWSATRVTQLNTAHVPSQVQKYAEQYFGKWKGAPDAVPASRASASEPAARPDGKLGSYEDATRAGPAAVFAYYRPGVASDDSTTLDVIRRACPCIATVPSTAA